MPTATCRRSQSRYKDRPTAPVVTLTTTDPATGKLAKATFPNYFTDADCRAQWTKLFDALRERMKKRGLEQAMMLGWFTDVRAQKGEIDFWSDVTGDLPWVSHAHYKIGKDLGHQTGYMTSIHDVGEVEDPAKGRKYGWKNPELYAQQLLRPGWRGEMDTLPGTMWSCMTELTMAGGQRGYGRLGGDTWRAIKDKNGRRVYRVYERYPWSIWNNLELCCSLLAPGPEGAVATAHFEQFREGVQACEARIYIEQALTDKATRGKLGDELAQSLPNDARRPYPRGPAGHLQLHESAPRLFGPLAMAIPDGRSRARLVPEHSLARTECHALRPGRRSGTQAGDEVDSCNRNQWRGT